MEYQIQSALQLQEHVSRTAIVVLLQLSVATAIIILSARLKVTFMANILVSMCELYN
jgi:hypothetical protein